MKPFLSCILLILVTSGINAQQGTACNQLDLSADAETTNDIVFPNAFRWNRSGPTGGYWSENQVDDCIFRPFANNISSYKLKVFTRSGSLIYESTDLHKGWDGYSVKGNLAEQGVYIWMARGKFIDGRPFSKIGDVTFLH